MIELHDERCVNIAAVDALATVFGNKYLLVLTTCVQDLLDIELVPALLTSLQTVRSVLAGH